MNEQMKIPACGDPECNQCDLVPVKSGELVQPAAQVAPVKLTDEQIERQIIKSLKEYGVDCPIFGSVPFLKLGKQSTAPDMTRKGTRFAGLWRSWQRRRRTRNCTNGCKIASSDTTLNGGSQTW